MKTEENELLGGRYALERELGRGGIGEVLLARDIQLERWVAVKRIHLQTEESTRRTQAVVDEAKRLACLQHPNIVTVFDVLDHRGDVLMVMEYLNGHTLEQLSEPLTPKNFFEVAQQALEGLGAAHAIGMVHLDIKPTNLMLNRLATGQIQLKLLDFGLATMMEQPASQTLGPDRSLLGSVYTMAPEQFEENPVGRHTDLYSLGCVLYYALTLQDPFIGDGVDLVMDAHLQHAFQPLAGRRPDLTPPLCAWVEHLMARRPEDRPESAAAALSSLQGLLVVGTAQPNPGNGEKKPGRLRRAVDAAATVAARLGKGKIQAVPSRVPPASARPADRIDPADRAGLIGRMNESVIVEGKVGRIWENVTGTLRFINFENIHHSDFSVVFPLKTKQPKFSQNRLEALIGRTIRVTGKVSEFHGCPQISVELPFQISVIDPGDTR